ncbi:BsaA family SipW-dependent biofilm matrix protein [Vagococcus hydrophili]|uniref:Alternate signal-mediated exported protein, CPF_0494 family n=1 Tax=Vagococcus hydrophili TaxID=2714947 RepID=A0A6G8ATY3_9ENTE|nr:BsaA family SipW-dependent biofilm matrix protein [Vagococcus hydrophili]QIL48429.1 hypothetical protein G7082_07940 [Vagococcus hydrophili]
MKSKNKKKWLATAAALAAVAAMAGTFAWFQSKDEVKNEFEGSIAGNDIEIVEDFEKPTTWEPNVETKKDVAVKNSGKYNAFIRVNLAEEITKLKSENLDGKYTSNGADIAAADYVMPLSMKKADIESKYPTVSTLEGTAPKITIKGKEYTLVVREKSETVDKGTRYQYLSYWDNGTEGEELYARTGGFVRKNDKLTPKNTPQVKYIKIEYQAPVKKDWTNPVYTPVTAGTPGGPIKGDGSASIVLKGAADDKIEIKFVNVSEKPVTGKWNYNLKDGSFYYIGVVPAQEQTAQLIESVKLSGAAGNEYSKVKYNLDVKAKGIQAHAEAVDSADWLGEKGPNNINGDISKALKELPETNKTK